MATDNWINPHTRIEQESRCICLDFAIIYCLFTAQRTDAAAPRAQAREVEPHVPVLEAAVVPREEHHPLRRVGLPDLSALFLCSSVLKCF